MKVILCIGLFVLAAQANAQVNIGPISKTAYCVGDTLFVPYQAGGSFAADNFFRLQISDGSGSFTTYTSFGRDTQAIGTFRYPLGTVARFRVRVIATDPYTVSAPSDSIFIVSGYPTPQPYPLEGLLSHPLEPAGLVGNPITVQDWTDEPPGTSYLWAFGQDAQPVESSQRSSSVIYATEGIKNASLTVTNPGGCSATMNFHIYVLSCSPVIPKTAHIVDSTEAGSDPVVWVKAGGQYSPSTNYQTIFVEPGGAVNGSCDCATIFYLRSGSSFTRGGGTSVIFIADTNVLIGPSRYFETLRCPDLQYDYSQVSGGVTDERPTPQISINQTPDRLLATTANQPLELRLLNLLGKEVLSRRATGELDIDLSSLTAGIYIAVAESGGQQVTKKIAVVN